MARILLIEDDVGQVALVQRWLPHHEVHVIDGAPSTHGMIQGAWDLIITDVELPGADGIALLSQRRHGTPALVITSHTAFHVAVGALKAGAADVLAKPFQKTDLRSAVDNLLAASASKRKRILAIGAHPDDVEIGVGGTLIRHSDRGDLVAVLTLSRGASGGLADVRENEARRAAGILGARLWMDDLPDTRIGSGPTTIEAIERAIREHQPDIVYTHSKNDRHQDHRGVYEATCIAARGVANVFSYQAPSTTIDFRPSKFVDVADTFNRKLDALAAYASQSQRAYMAPEHIASTADYWGRFASFGRVEPLEVHRQAGFAA